MRKPPTADDIARILSEWAKRRTYREIAVDLGLAENAVMNVILRSSGQDADKAKSDHIVNMKARKSAFSTGKRKNANRDAAVTAKWLEGKSAAEIADDVGVTRNVVIGIVHRNNVKRSSPTRQSIQRAAHRDGCVTKLARSERQRAETAQAMVERRRMGTLLRHPPQLTLVSSVELPPRKPEPPEDLYAHMRTEESLRRALAAMVVPRDTGTGIK